MKRDGKAQPEISIYCGVRETAQLLGVSENRMAEAVTLPDGSLGCAAFPMLTRIQDKSPAAGARGSAILFVREQVIALAEVRRQPPQVKVESVRPISFSEEETRILLGMGRAGARVLRMKL